MPLTLRRLTILAGIAAIGMLSGCGVRYNGAASTPSSSPDQAQAALARFVGSEHIPHGNWEANNTPAGPRLKTVIPGFGIFEVDANTYQVTEAVFENRMLVDNGGKQVTVSMASALSTAADFASQHFTTFAQLEQKEAELDDHGTFKEYSFLWQQREGEAWLPTFVHVTINPGSGAVNSYSSQVVSVKVSTHPSVDDGQARAAAMTAAHLVGQVSIKSDGLQVLLEDNGSQRLAWVYELTVVHTGTYIGLASGDHVVQVDALTGVAKQVAS